MSINAKPIFLIGYMGSGKTTLGNAVAARAHIPFVDLDHYIEQSEGMTVKEIFAAKGENGFRLIERQALTHFCCSQTPILVACGGGTPCFFDNMELMNSAGTTIFLDASIPTLVRRLSQARAQRPLIANLNDEQLAEFINKNLNARLPLYSKCSARFTSDNLESEEMIDTSARNFIENFL